MGFIERNRGANEEIRAKGRTSIAYIVFRPLIQVASSVGLGLVVGLVASAQGAGSNSILYTTVGIGLLGTLFTAVPSFIDGIALLLSLEVGVTNQRVILKWGLFHRNVVDTYLSKIEGVDVHQTLLGRILGYGSICVRGTGGKSSPCPGVANPEEFRREVHEAIEDRFGH